MNRRFVTAAVVGFIFTFLYDWLIHGFFLMKHYEFTEYLWRDKNNMKLLFPVALAFQLAFSIIVTWLIYFHPPKDKDLLRYLTIFGLLMGLNAAAMYPYLDIPVALGISWFSAGFIEGFLLVYLVYVITQPKKSKK